jgi:hypothetical protein
VVLVLVLVCCVYMGLQATPKCEMGVLAPTSSYALSVVLGTKKRALWSKLQLISTTKENSFGGIASLRALLLRAWVVLLCEGLSDKPIIDVTLGRRCDTLV